MTVPVKVNGGTTIWLGAPSRFASLSRIASFECPSDDGAEPAISITRYESTLTNGGQVTVNIGAFPSDAFSDVDRIGKTNYCPVSGAYGDAQPNHNSGWENFVGVYYNRSETTFGSIGDGSSNVFVFGEVQQQLVESWPPFAAGQEMAYSWMGSNVVSMGWFDWQPGDFLPGQTFRFSSKHPGSINFAYGDGSVRTVSQSADWFTMAFIAGADDGRVASLE